MAPEAGVTGVKGVKGRPQLGTVVLATALLIALWGTLRLILFDTIQFPLAYAVPLLVHVWTRNRVALWVMAAVFAAFHSLKVFVLTPEGMLSQAEVWASYGRRSQISS
jgi:hypothetical protein